ncbi:uncharacterized protein RSE6_01310 [Rhynchosporium secalis]|uniref:Secreted protein n=1 Tax=Rhynchosporium secalis TaxID=38038 RepID=A0A1E1LXF9_RHYSE|nr:uncharacterized protein RSE6_01310 [Rhynchosporium secalis]
MHTTKLLLLALATATTDAYTLVVCQLYRGATTQDVEWGLLHRRHDMGLGEKGVWKAGARKCPLGKKTSETAWMYTFCRSDPYSGSGGVLPPDGGVVECRQSGSYDWPACKVKC